MKLPFLFALVLVLSLVFEGPTAASARCVRRRWACRRYGGVVGFCRIRRCARYRCRGRGRRGRRGRRCRCRRYRTRRGFQCARDTLFEEDSFPDGDGAPSFCQEQCIRTWRGARLGCNRSLCFIRPCSGNLGYFKCTAGAVPEIPGPQVCFGGCAVSSPLRPQCNAAFCSLQRCDQANPNRFSCVPKFVTTRPPTTTTGTTVAGMTTTTGPTTTTVRSCPTVCVTARNGQLAFLSVIPTCQSSACKVIFCKVAEVGNTFGYACVGATTPGSAVRVTPQNTQTLTPSTSTTTTTAISSSTTTTTTTGTGTTTTTTGTSTTSTTTMTGSTTTTTTTTSTTPTGTTSTTTTTTTTTTLAPGVVTAEEWDRCTITRGGTRNRQNAQPAPNGNPINVDVTVIQAGVVNLACKQSHVSVSCSTDGSITVSIDADQAAQLDLSAIYPLGAVFAYDRSVFTAPCILNSFPLTANQDQAIEAQRQLRQRAAEVQDVFLRISGVSGTPERAVIRGTRVSALNMFSSARIFNVAMNRALSEASYEASITMARANPAVRQLFPLNEDRFSARIDVGTTSASFNGQLDNEGNRIETINLQVNSNGNFIDTRYVVRRRYDVQYTMAINNAGDSAIRRTVEPLALSTIRTGFPSVNVTPTNNPPNCCNIPDLRFEEFFEIRPFLTVGSNAGGEISAVGYNHRVVYPQQDLTITAIGPIANPVVSVSPLAVLPPTTAALTAASAVSINPTTSTPFDFDINVGMTPSLSLFFPSLVASLQQKASIKFNTRSGAETGVPAAEDAPIDNGACAAVHNLRINTVEELVDSQFVSIGGGDVQGTVGGRTQPIPGMDSTAQDFVRNDCFFP